LFLNEGLSHVRNANVLQYSFSDVVRAPRTIEICITLLPASRNARFSWAMAVPAFLLHPNLVSVSSTESGKHGCVQTHAGNFGKLFRPERFAIPSAEDILALTGT